MTELLDAADSSRESLRLEPKWLRVTYTCVIEKKEMTDWMDAAKDSSVMRNRMNESDKLWKLHLCASRSSVHFETVRSHTSNAISDILSTSGDGSTDAFLIFEVTRKRHKR